MAKLALVTPRALSTFPAFETNLSEVPKLTISDIGFTAFALAAEALVTIAVAAATGIAYHLVEYGVAGDVLAYLEVGTLAALFYMLPFLFRDEYRLHTYAEARRNAGRLFSVWNYTFLCVGLIAFLTKSTAETSRGWVVLFYVAGLMATLAVPVLVSRLLKQAMRSGRVKPRRVMLLGAASELKTLAAQIDEEASLIRIAAMEPLPMREASLGFAGESRVLKETLRQAAATARALRVDDVIIGTEWSRDTVIREIVECFADLPLSIHLAASRLLGSYANAGLSRLSGIKVISLAAPPLAPLQLLSKRLFDVVVSGVALLLLSPLFLIVAALIKLSSPGPVFFRQRRSGYNCEEFRIWKFRTMTTMEDGEGVVQAAPGDRRVTPIGRYLRALNIDELPQLINVLRGDMSLVGPRPHAVTHDLAFAKRVSSYSRRLNVLPGITGWAQVNGFRGPTQNDTSLRGRIRHDLHYIDNWSMLFDLYIIALTLLSSKSYRNAI